ncbi:hypothetical protein DYH09_34295 [bacterium CPR1]|nr:hypothetical protein [bacterium CPR1]
MSDTDWSASSTSELVFCLPDGGTVEAPLEWTPAEIQLPIEPEQLARVTLLRSEVPLPLAVRHRHGRLCLIGEWPRSGPGHYRLNCPQVGSQWTVTVLPRKISSTALEQMVEDLQFGLLASIGLALQRMGGLVGVKVLPPDRSTLAGELLRLERAVGALSEILPEVGREPHGMLMPFGVVVPCARARRPTVRGLQQAFRMGGNFDRDGCLLRVEDGRVELTWDVMENRLLRSLVDQVGQRLRRIGRLTMVENLHGSLRKAMQGARFLAGVRPLHGPPTGTSMVLLKRPPYRRALRLLQELRNEPALDLREPALDAPLENLPYLYECWGVMQVLQALCEFAQEEGYVVQEQRLVHLANGQPFFQVLRDGRPAVILRNAAGTCIKAIPQRRYLRGSGGLRSLSFTQVPDLALERERVDGSVSVLILDPKYKLDSGEDQPQKVDIDKMHAYRDAIRDEQGRPVIRTAGILYPGRSLKYGDSVLALRAAPGESESLRLGLRDLLADFA